MAYPSMTETYMKESINGGKTSASYDVKYRFLRCFGTFNIRGADPRISSERR